MTSDGAHVRPTIGLLHNLDLKVPKLTVPIHDVDHTLIGKAQMVPSQVASRQATRIKKLKSRHWFKVKQDSLRGGVTRLVDGDEFVEANSLSHEHRWWLCLSGIRAEDSPQRNFYDCIHDEMAERSLPVQDDLDRLTAEIANTLIDLIQEHIRRCAYRSMQSCRFVPIDYAENRMVTAIRAFPSNETYISISTTLNNTDDYVVALSAFEGISPSDWLPEHQLPIDILGNTDGELVFSTLFTPQAQAALLKEGDEKGWSKGWN